MAEESTARDVADQFKGIVRDLFNIEVNTILRDKITAQKMPGVRNALMDIGIEYFEILEKAEEAYRAKYGQNRKFKTDKILDSFGFFYLDTDRVKAELEYKEKPPEPDRINGEFMIVDQQVCKQLGGFEAFTIMRRWADGYLQDQSFLQDLRSADGEKKRILSVLPRIRENADMLKGMFSRICRRELDKLTAKGLTNRLKDKESSKLTPETVVKESWEFVKYNSEKIDSELAKSLTNQYTRSEIISITDPLEPKMDHSELVMVRKIWEVGTEVIAMQTTIQVDGDVITRLNPNYLDVKSYDKLSGYHNDGVNIALKYWGSLVSVARELMDRVGKGLRG